MRHVLFLGVVGLGSLSLTALVAESAGPASSDPPQGCVKISNPSSGVRLGLHHHTASEDGDAAAQWRLEPAGEYYKLRNEKSGQYLGLPENSKRSGGPTLQMRDSPDAAIFWKLQPAGDGLWRIINRDTGTCLEGHDNNGSTVVRNAAVHEGAAEQQWRVRAADAPDREGSKSTTKHESPGKEHVRWLDFGKLQTGDEGKIRYPVTVLTFVDSRSCVVVLKSPETYPPLLLKNAVTQDLVSGGQYTIHQVFRVTGTADFKTSKSSHSALVRIHVLEPVIVESTARPAERSATSSREAPSARPAAASASASGPLLGDVTQIVAKVDPAVATIRCPHGTGSGFVVDDRGILITNCHVVVGEGEAVAVFPDKTTYRVLGVLAFVPGKDLTLLKIDPGTRKLASLRLAQTAPVKGEKVYAFGAPLGMSGSVSDGLVAAIRRGQEVRQNLQDLSGRDVYVQAMHYDLDAGWIQTTAPISPGNSGGPLVNGRGEVVGVNTWHVPIGENINFAVSAEHIQQMLQSCATVPRPLSDLPAPKRAASASSGQASGNSGGPGDVQAGGQGGYVASKNSKVFHRPDCKAAEKISENNLLRFATRDAAIRAGKRPCTECKP
jgi:S1-C subfamily serine protease